MTWDNDKFSDSRERFGSDEKGWSRGSGRGPGFWIRLALIPAVVLVGLWLFNAWGVV